MDRYNLIALGMLLAVVTVALMKRTIDGQGVKDIITFLSGGVVGVTMPRRGDPTKPGGVTTSPAMVMLVVGSILLLTR